MTTDLHSYSPNFLYVHPNGKVQIITYSQAIKEACSYPPSLDTLAPNPSSPLISLKEALAVSKSQGKPCSLFPEATTSNNRGLLKFSPVFDSVNLETDLPGVQIVGFKYQGDERVPPTFTVTTQLPQPTTPASPRFSTIGFIEHLFAVATQVSHGLEVKILDVEETKENFTGAASAAGAAATMTASAMFRGETGAASSGQSGPSGKVSLLLGQVTRLRMTGLAMEDKQGFWEYYFERETKAKKAPSARKEISDMQADRKRK
ncbi:hypothetical protein HDU96_007261 [Phlyctochytrium bullatum]|nr:hypothetical protein HDU96_007261 [Phlyctochytrium bullatum]